MSKEDKKAKKAAKKAAKAEKKANKTPMDVDVKVTLIRCICAIVCVAIVVLSLSNGIGKISDTKLEIAKSVSGESADGIGGDDGDYTDDGAVTDDGTATADGEIKDDPAATDETPAADDTSAADNSSSGGATAPSNNSGSSNTASNTGSASKAPSTTAEVLNYYNTATKKVADKKLAFSKERISVEKKYEAGFALKQFKGTVYKFMGVGDDNKFVKNVTKEDADSYYKYFQASNLTASDVTSAKCTSSNGTYTITIALKPNSSEVKDGKVVKTGKTPLDKCGISAGEKDKNYWDHKSAENIYSAISQVPGCGSANISESYSGATVKAVIDSNTGNLKSLVVKFDFNYNISNVMGSTGVAQGSSTVNMKNFKW